MTTLPFTVEQFLDVFATYNELLWPAALLLWIATLGALLLLTQRDSRATKTFGLLLAFHWGWAGVAYHLAFFRDINPAAVLFGVLFLAQAGLLAWWTLRSRASIQWRPTFLTRAGVVLMGYALIYPVLGLALGLSYARMPTFGVPCPTTLLTAGALLVARDAAPRWLGVIPLAWTVVGGSAALLLGVHADLALPIAAALLLASMMLPRQSHGVRPPPVSASL